VPPLTTRRCQSRAAFPAAREIPFTLVRLGLEKWDWPERSVTTSQAAMVQDVVRPVLLHYPAIGQGRGRGYDRRAGAGSDAE